MANLLYATENFSTTLNVPGGIDSSQTTGIVLTSVTGLNTNGGILCFDWATTLDTAVAEYIEYGGISSNTLTGVVRGVNGVSAKAHSNAAVIVGIVDAQHINRLNDKLRGVDATLALDASGNAIIKTASAASAVNQLTVTNAATASGPILAATGTDTNIDLLLVSKGSGAVKVNGVSITTVSSDGWVSDANTWTYSSVDGPTGVLTINADVTGTMQIGDRVKFTQTTVKYFIVSKAPSFAAGSTTLTIYGGTDYTLANAAITSPSYSHTKLPFGFNASPAKWTEAFSDTANQTQATPGSGTWYNVGTSKLDIPIGVWRTYYQCVAGFNNSSVGDTMVRVSLSTANNSQGDAEMSAVAFVAGADQRQVYMNLHREKTLTLTAKTTYYLNLMTTSGSRTSLDLYGSDYGTTIIRAVSALL